MKMKIDRDAQLLDDPLYHPEDAARLLGVRAGTMGQWRFRKQGPAYVHTPLGIRYARSALIAFMRQRRRRRA
jgi:hypothetical protein